MTTPLLDVRGLARRLRRAAEVLFGIDLAVAPGEVVGVLGRNGMGKTTLVRTIMGLHAPARRRDRVRAASASTAARAEPDRARRRRASCPKVARSSPTSAVREHLTRSRASRSGAAAPWTPARVLELFPALQRAALATWATSSPAASSRCSRSAARW